MLENDDEWRHDGDAAQKRLNYEQIRSVLEMHGLFLGINRKVQIKKTKEETSFQLILKWGGEITPAGIEQAEDLGRYYQSFYPKDEGLLKLHQSFRHDLKVYASDEGRVQMTAASFSRVEALEGKMIFI